jgi:hypothetical protein
VRHNEDELNEQLARLLPWRVRDGSYDDPHTKAFLLLQAHCCHVALPIRWGRGVALGRVPRVLLMRKSFVSLRARRCSDYINDTKSVLDQSLRIINAMVGCRAWGGALWCPRECAAQVDIAADAGLLSATLRAMEMSQRVVQARPRAVLLVRVLLVWEFALLFGVWAASARVYACACECVRMYLCSRYLRSNAWVPRRAGSWTTRRCCSCRC